MSEAYVLYTLQRTRDETTKQTGHIKNFSFAGVYSDGATPDPIPNSEVKSVSGDGSARVTVWESSTMPASFCGPGLFTQTGFFLRDEQIK